MTDMKDQITHLIPAECPWRDTLYWYDTIDSTNIRAKEMAKQGAPHGTVVLAGHQSAGRGRLGRSFHSPEQKGMYLSVILRPDCLPEQLMHLTCAVGVAVCNAIEALMGLRPGIKWINDLVVNGKKLGGILTELSLDQATGKVDWTIVGIGINCSHGISDFPEELQSIATSLSLVTGNAVQLAAVSASVIDALHQMDQVLFSGKADIMNRYRSDCITLQKEILVVRGDEKRYGRAVGIDDEGALLVSFDGRVEAVNSGEASIRGMYGYV